MRNYVLVLLVLAGVGCGPSLTDLCRDECSKENACAALDPSSGQPTEDCNAECPDIGVSITSTSACNDIGGADSCINAVTASGQGAEAAAQCNADVSACLSQNCG